MAMFEDADPFNRGAITYEALKGQLEKHGGLLENLTISIDRWLVPLPLDSSKKNSKKSGSLQTRLPHQLTAMYMRNNYVFLSFLTFLVAINVGLFVSRAIQYRKQNIYVIIARACGECASVEVLACLIEIVSSFVSFVCISFVRFALGMQFQRVINILFRSIFGVSVK